MGFKYVYISSNPLCINYYNSIQYKYNQIKHSKEIFSNDEKKLGITAN